MNRLNQIVKKFKRNRIFDFAKQRRKIKCVCFHSFFRKETNKQKQNKFKVEKSDWCFICREHHSIIYWHISMSKSTRKFSKNVFFPSFSDAFLSEVFSPSLVVKRYKIFSNQSQYGENWTSENKKKFGGFVLVWPSSKDWREMEPIGGSLSHSSLHQSLTLDIGSSGFQDRGRWTRIVF